MKKWLESKAILTKIVFINVRVTPSEYSLAIGLGEDSWLPGNIRRLSGPVGVGLAFAMVQSRLMTPRSLRIYIAGGILCKGR